MPRGRVELFLSSRSWIDPKQWFTPRDGLVPPCPTGHLAISGDIFGFHDSGRGGLLLASKCVETRHAAKLLHAQDSPHNKGLSSAKCQ